MTALESAPSPHAAPSRDRPPTARDGSVPVMPEMGHVHGLGVNPGDGDVYAATHTGVFRAAPARVADHYQDTMGSTVVGPDEFLASGHPDLQERDLPTHLGLIANEDGAETWDLRSLAGEADFPAPDAGLLVGADAAVLRSTDEGRTRQTAGGLRVTRHRRLGRALGAVALGLTVVLTGCGTESGADAAPELSATEHNDADVAFASDLIQRHAVSMSLIDLTLGRELDPEAQRLVEELRATQSTQIETTAGWLLRWGEPIPETVRDHSNAGHGGDDGPKPGVAGTDARTALEALPASEFEDAWLRAMLDHHEDTLARARAHQDEGRFEPAVEMAEQVISQQSQRLTTMEKLLDG